MTLRRLSLVSAACAAVLALPLAAGAASSKDFTDPAGDAGEAPDLQRVTVSNTNAGLVRFQLAYANRTALAAEDTVFIAVDADRNRATGDPDGTEYLLLVEEGRAGLARWTGDAYDFDVPQTTFKADGRTWEVNRSELGNLGSFDFYVGSFAGDGEDYGPDDPDQVYTYELDFTPELRALAAAFTPKQPRAGKIFAVSGLRVQTDTAVVAPDSRRCTAKLAGKTLKPLAPCRWRLPKKSQGKLLVVTIAVTYKGVTGTAQPYRFRVRR